MGGLTLSKNADSVTRGAYCKEVTVVTATDLSGTEILEKKRDLAVEMELDVGRDFTPKFTLMGNFKVENGNVVDWGGAFVVKNLFQDTGCFEGLDDEKVNELLGYFEQSKIPKALLQRLIGKKFYKIDYVNGIKEKDGVKKATYSSWNIINQDKEKLEEEWKKSLKRGYPSNYDPDSLDNLDDNTDFNYGENAKSNGEAVEEKDDDFVL